ncbi:MAG: hypothetical protein K6E19_11500 [Lachnospiraceae bacterium]|nr:hypothetical protein [Lachnospiraceae bacterium]
MNAEELYNNGNWTSFEGKASGDMGSAHKGWVEIIKCQDGSLLEFSPKEEKSMQVNNKTIITHNGKILVNNMTKMRMKDGNTYALKGKFVEMDSVRDKFCQGYGKEWSGYVFQMMFLRRTDE